MIVKLQRVVSNFNGLKTQNGGGWNDGDQSITNRMNRSVTTTMDQFLTVAARRCWDDRGDD